MPNRSRKRPRDANQLVKMIVGIATGEEEERPEPGTNKNPAAVELGRKGGLKGGKARMAKLSQEERQQLARQAAHARWRRAK